MTRSKIAVGLSTLLLAAALPACGIRGRPQPPLIILPAVVSDLSAVRLGDEVHLELTVPEANADGSLPPDIERIDIYAVTTLPDADDEPIVFDEWIEDEEPILTLDVVVPEEPEAGVADEPADRAAEAPAEDRTYAPGEVVTAIEPLTPDIVAPVEFEREEEEEEEDVDEDEEELDAVALEEAMVATPLAGPLVSPPLPRVARRTYVAVAVSMRNRQSAAYAAPPVPVQPAPDPPGLPVLTYAETSIALEWTAPDTAWLPVQRAPETEDAPEATQPAEAVEQAETAPAPEAADETEPPETVDETEPAETVDETEPAAAVEAVGPTDETQAADAVEVPDAAAFEAGQVSDTGELGAGAIPMAAPPVLQSTTLLQLQTPTRYDVYDVSPPAETETETEIGTGESGEPDGGDGGILRPLNDPPLAATSYAVAEATLGVERCFYVRTVDTVDPVDRLAIRSAASETTCVLLADIFPPAAPTGLVAVAGAGAISLTWTANGEADLAGYVLLRGRDPEAELEPLTPAPIAATNYRDTEVETGVDYVYAVQAVDRSDPPNVSAASEQVVEQAP